VVEMSRYKITSVVDGFIAGFLRKKELLEKFADRIQIFDFDSIQPGLNWIIDKAVVFYKRYGSVPTLEFLMVELERENLSEDRKAVLAQLIERLYSLSEDEISYKVDLFRDEMVRLLLSSFLPQLTKRIEGENVMRIVEELNKFVVDVRGFYAKESVIDFGKTFADREQRRRLLLRERVMRTGIRDLDEQVRITYRSVTAFLAPYKRYKSITLTNMGWAALVQGFNVLHVNYEGRQELWEARYDARFADMDFNKVFYMRRSESDQQRLEAVARMIDSWKQRLFLMRGIAYVTSVDDILSVINDIERARGLYIDVVIIDYFQIMGASGIKFGEEEDWWYQHKIAWDLVRLANSGELGRIVIGALQTKMSAVTAESLRSDQSGRSIAYPQVLDNIIAINQTRDEHVEGIIRFSPVVIREGEIKKEHCKVEAELWKIKVAKEMDSLLDEVV
jgi:hypothetical protein